MRQILQTNTKPKHANGGAPIRLMRCLRRSYPVLEDAACDLFGQYEFEARELTKSREGIISEGPLHVRLARCFSPATNPPMLEAMTSELSLLYLIVSNESLDLKPALPYVLS